MPKLSDLIDQKEKKKKFTRKEYRPWNLGETLSKETQKEEVSEKHNVTQKVMIPTASTALSRKTVEDESSAPVINVDNQTNYKEPISSFTRPNTIELSVGDLITQLSGRQKEILILIIRNLIDNRSLVTSPIYSQQLVEKINTSYATIKNAIRRLEAKGLIKSISKRARGGHFRFEVTQEVIQAGHRLFFRP